MSQPSAQARAITQNKEAQLKTYNKRLRDDVKSMADNFTEIVKLAKVEEETQVSKVAQSEEDQYEMQVRAANIVRAGESLLKLVSDIKQFLILNDFRSVNDNIFTNRAVFQNLQKEIDTKLLKLRDEMASDLHELEEDYYSSMNK